MTRAQGEKVRNNLHLLLKSHLDSLSFFFYARSMAKPVKKSSTPKKQKHNYVNFFGLVVVGLIIGIAAAYPAKDFITKAAEKAGIVQVSETQAALTWDSIPNAASYNIYYKAENDPDFTYAINVPSTVTQYVLPELKSGVKYVYKIAAVSADNQEFLWTPVNPLPRK